MPDLWACRQHQACCAALWRERQRSSLVSVTSHGEKHKWHCCHIKVLVCLEVFRPQWTGHTRDPVSLFLSILVYTLPFQVCLVFIHFKYLCTEIAPWIVLRLAVKHNLSIHLSTLAPCNSVPIYRCCSKSALLLRKAFQRMLHQPIVK